MKRVVLMEFLHWFVRQNELIKKPQHLRVGGCQASLL